MGLVCNREYVFGGVYLIAWIFLAVGCVHYKWLWFYPEPNDKYSYCHAGLWQVCCPKPSFFVASQDSRSLNDEFEECKTFSNTDEIAYPPNFSKNAFFDAQLWTIRAFMLAASVVPLVALGSRMTGSYIHALILMIISGLFGAVVVVSSLFFALEYIADEESDDKFSSITIGPSFVFVMCGTAAIWLFSFIDLVMINKNFKITDKTEKEAETVENPYSENIEDVETGEKTEKKVPETSEEPTVNDKAPEKDAQNDAEL